MKYIGQSVPALNNRILAAGKGTFVGDLTLPNGAWLALLRSTHAHARIRSIDVSRARALPGVLSVVTGAELRARLRPTPWASDPSALGGRTVEIYALAGDRVRYVGEPLVAVVAEDKLTAHAAVAQIEVDYEPLPAVTNAVEALQKGSALVEPGWGCNVMLEKTFTRGDFEAAARTADGVLRGAVRTHRYTAVPLEPRAYAASYDPYGKRLTVWSSTQNPHSLRGFIAETLSLPDSHIRVIQPHVGGGFGQKVPPFSEEILVSYLSRELERPVKFIEERTEHLLAGGHAREEVLFYEAAYQKDGRVTGLSARVVADVGAPGGLCGWAMSFVSAFCIPGAYRIDNCKVELSTVVTNKCPWNGYRAFGKEAASFLMERIMDKVAKATGLDRAEVRFRNFLPPDAFPFRQVSGAVLDSGNYGAVLGKLLELMDYGDFARHRTEAKQAGRYIGFGFGFELTPEGGAVPHSRTLQGWDGTNIRISPEGWVTVLTGVTSPGSGNETGIAQIVADELGVEIDRIQVIQGDTETCPFGLGNYSSRSIMMGGGAAALAARDLRDKLLAVAAKMLEVSSDDLEPEGGVIRVKGAPQRTVTVAQVAQEIYRHTYGPAAEGVEPGLEVTRYSRIGNLYHQPERQDGHFSMYPTWPNGVCGVVVEVDPETGLVRLLRCAFVHDCGTVINPLLVEANLHGGLAQGFGGALFEQLVYDEEGQLRTASLMDYTLPTAVDLPQFEVGHLSTPSPFTGLGTKGAGESGVAAPLTAVISAVEDALSDWDVTIDQTPLTPERVWKAIHANASAENKGGRPAA